MEDLHLGTDTMTGEEEEMTEDTLRDQEAVLDLTKGGQCTTGEVAVAVAEEIHALVLHPTEEAVHHLVEEEAAHHLTEVIVPHLTGAKAHQISSATEAAAPEAVIDSL